MRNANRDASHVCKQADDEKNMDFGELQNDTDFVTKATDLDAAITAIETHMGLLQKLNYDSLSKEDKVKYDLFQTYATNSLFWMFLKLQGQDPSQHGITHELARVKDGMQKEKLYHDKKKMPRLDKGASKRFVKHGLKIPREPQEQKPQNRKRKFDD